MEFSILLKYIYYACVVSLINLANNNVFELYLRWVLSITNYLFVLYLHTRARVGWHQHLYSPQLLEYAWVWLVILMFMDITHTPNVTMCLNANGQRHFRVNRKQTARNRFMKYINVKISSRCREMALRVLKIMTIRHGPCLSQTNSQLQRN